MRIPPARPTRNAVTGFTLVELLVVIAIIGLLAGMLFPAIQAAMEKANRTHCMNNLAGIGKGLIMYSMDHAGAFPTNLLALTDGGYVEEPEAFVCRSDRWRKAAPELAAINAGTADAYCSYNLVTHDRTGAWLNNSVSGRMLLACDKNGSDGNVTAAAFGGNHRAAGGNMLRADGSVRWVERAAWLPKLWDPADLASVAGY